MPDPKDLPISLLPRTPEALALEKASLLLLSPNPVPSSPVPYLVAMFGMALMAIAAALLITTLRPAQDNASLVEAIFGFAAPTTMGLLAYMKAQETHRNVNSRLDQFIAAARLVAHAQGREEGREEIRSVTRQAAAAAAAAAGTDPT